MEQQEKIAAIGKADAATLKAPKTAWGASDKTEAFEQAEAVAARSALLGRLGSANIFRHVKADGEAFYLTRMGSTGSRDGNILAALPDGTPANFGRWLVVNVPEGADADAGKALAVAF